MPEKVNKREADVVADTNEQWKDAEETNNEWLMRAVDAYRFYTGLQQWDPQVISQLIREGRPYLTINLIFPYINLLWGFQSQNRDDIKLYPRHGGTAAVAALGSELIKHTFDTCEGHDEYSDAFGDGLICGKGWVGVERLYNNDVLFGDLVVEKKSPFNIVEDQNNRSYNINKGNFIFETYWWTKQQVELQWPDKAKYIKEATSSPDYEEDVFSTNLGLLDDYSQANIVADESRRKTHFRIKERWYKNWEKSIFIVHLPTLIVKRITDTHLKVIRERELLRDNNDFKIIERPAQILYKSITLGEMVLEHTKDPFDGINLFPYVRFCPYYIDGYIMGMVDNIKGPQQEVNKRRSQTLHNLNMTAHSGFKVKEANDRKALRNLENFGSRPGVVIDKSKFGGEVDEITAKPLDVGHFTMAEQSAKDIQTITGINPSLLEQTPEAKESGRAKIARQQVGLMPSQKISDNSGRSEIQLGYFIWEFIRSSDVYSEQEVESIVERHTLKQFIKVDETGRQTIDLSPMRSWRLGRYGVLVSRSSSIPTVRLANFEQMLDLRNAGLPIPDEMIIEGSDVANKEEIINYIKQGAARGAVNPIVSNMGRSRKRLALTA
jgi:hypothetical protein